MAQQPMISEEELCLSDKRVVVNVSNLMINRDEIHVDPLFNITLDIIKQHSIYNAITLTTDAPEIYISSPRQPGQPFVQPPCQDELVTFIKKLGYADSLTTISQVVVNKLHQPWRMLLSILNKCLTGKSSGVDRAKEPIVQIMWGLVNLENVDFAKLIWEYFRLHEKGGLEVNAPKKKTADIATRKCTITFTDNLLEDPVNKEVDKAYDDQLKLKLKAQNRYHLLHSDSGRSKGKLMFTEMATTDKESSAAGTDNHPPMLEESDFESWKIHIERYIRGKPLGKLIWKSIKNGPSPHPMITVTIGEGEQQTQVTREKTDEEFTKAENNKEHADIQATNILSQGLPRHIFNTLDQTETTKEIWENVELLMQGSGLTEQQKKETLFDQYERNTKFVNNLPSYWGKYATIVKNSKDISTMSYVDLYTHLKSYEQHAMKTLSKMNQTSGNADPLAYISQATQSTSSPSQYVPPLPQYAPVPQQAPRSTNDAMLAIMNQIVNLLSGFQKQFPPTNNQLRTSTNLKTQAIIQAGQITTESVQRRAPGNKGKLAATGSQGMVVTCYNCRGQGHMAKECKEKKRAKDSYHEDAYDSDVDEAPHAAVAFMANLMQTGPSTGQGTSNDTDFHLEVHTYDNHFFDNMNLRVSQEIHKGEQLDSDVDSVIDDHDN
ncbi:trichome birefringence-like protein 2 [Tanacetum coccineum]